jgi:oligopeptide/dipeptide ABC transporter ATP-binding protein
MLDAPVSPDERAPAAELLGVSRHFASRGPSGRKATIRAVDDVDLRLDRGRTLGLVGESGSGKSTVARVLLRLLPPTGGRIVLDGDDITSVGGARLRHLRRKMQLVFQDPYSSFDPLAPIGSSIEEALRVHTDLTRAARRVRTQELLEQVRLPGAFARRHPRELSGGQLQRAAIARALSAEPQLLALDEPVSSLDAATQVQIVDLLAELQERLGIAYLFISHDLTLVRALSDEVAVMYFGRIVESAPAARVFEAPVHPYTQALLAASPRFGRRREDAPAPLVGDVPSPIDPPSGCSFRTRCTYALDVCAEEDPPITRGDGSIVRCHLVERPAPSPTVEPER